MVFCLDTLHRCSITLHGCSHTLHGYSDCFLIYTQKVIYHFPAHIFSDQMLLGYPLKLLPLSTDYVTKKITVVPAVYYYNSGSVFASKNFVTESVLKVRSFMRDILASLD